VSGFTAHWLELREPADSAARSAAVVDAVRGHGAPTAPRIVVDLGSGTGANLRYLAPRLGGNQEWVLVDDDPALLTAARTALIEWGRKQGATVVPHERAIRISAGHFACSVRTIELDLARDLAELAVPRGCLVTASALLDLVSARWLESLAELCKGAAAHVLFALTYDGRMTLTPPAADDELAQQCFNGHQHRDKGFGPALGPHAPRTAARVFGERGYDLTWDASDWWLDSSQRGLAAALVDGWLDAALEIVPDARARLEIWHAEHRRHIAAGQSEVAVGHRDFSGVAPIGQ
jgi:SAM-dependent methyltransferase